MRVELLGDPADERSRRLLRVPERGLGREGRAGAEAARLPARAAAAPAASTHGSRRGTRSSADGARSHRACYTRPIDDAAEDEAMTRKTIETARRARRRSAPIRRRSTPATRSTCPARSASIPRPDSWSRAPKRRRIACLQQPARRRAGGGRRARRHRQAHAAARRPRRFRQGQRDHGAVLQAALSGARDLPGRGAAEGRRASKSKASLVLRA